MYRWNGLAIIYRSEISFLADFNPPIPPLGYEGKSGKGRSDVRTVTFTSFRTVVRHALFPYRFVRSKIVVPY